MELQFVRPSTHNPNEFGGRVCAYALSHDGRKVYLRFEIPSLPHGHKDRLKHYYGWAVEGDDGDYRDRVPAVMEGSWFHARLGE